MGKVKLIRSGKKVGISNGDILKSGDIIKTGKNSFCELVYKDRSKITIRSKSKAKIGTQRIKGSSYIALISGSLKGKFAKIRKGRGRKIYSATTVAAIRGTEFSMEVNKGEIHA